MNKKHEPERKYLPSLPPKYELSNIKYLPVPNQIIKQGVDAVKRFCYLNYTIKEPAIGEGGFGEVFAACRNQNDKHCNKWVLKRIRSDAGEHPDELKRERSEIKKEVYIHRRLKGTRIAPELLNAWECNGAYYLILERYDMDMLALGRMQFDEARKLKEKVQSFKDFEPSYRILLYTGSQFREMFKIAQRLGQEYKFVHGDGKPDNMLYRKSSGQIVYGDFGFSGDGVHWRAKYGAVGQNADCQSDFVESSNEFVLYYNVWEVYQYFLEYAITFVQTGPMEYRLFDGFRDNDMNQPWYIPPRAKQRIEKACPNAKIMRRETEIARFRSRLKIDGPFDSLSR